MDRIENGIYGIHRSSTETHKSFLIHYSLWGVGYLKRILTGLHCNKCNEIIMWHSDSQNKFLFLFLVLCSNFSSITILIFGFEGWQLCMREVGQGAKFFLIAV